MLTKYYRIIYNRCNEETHCFHLEIDEMFYCVNVYIGINEFLGKINYQVSAWKEKKGKTVDDAINRFLLRETPDDLTNEQFVDHPYSSLFRSKIKISARDKWKEIIELLEKYFTIEGFTLADGSFGMHEKNELQQHDFEALAGQRFDVV